MWCLSALVLIYNQISLILSTNLGPTDGLINIVLFHKLHLVERRLPIPFCAEGLCAGDVVPLSKRLEGLNDDLDVCFDQGGTCSGQLTRVYDDEDATDQQCRPGPGDA